MIFFTPDFSATVCEECLEKIPSETLIYAGDREEAKRNGWLDASTKCDHV